MQKPDLLPKIEMEYDLVKFSYDSLRDAGKVLDFTGELYHEESKNLQRRVLSGEDMMMDFSLPARFQEAYINDKQSEAILKTLEDLKGRRDHLAEIEKNVFNPNVDYSVSSNYLSMSDLTEKALDQLINNPRGMFLEEWYEFFEAIGGFIQGEHVGIGGGSGTGKTTTALSLFQLLQNKYVGLKSGFISCEMSPTALGKKIIKSSQGIRTRQLIESAHKQADQIREADYKGWANCSFAFDVNSIAGIEKFIQKNKPSWVVIDHFGFIHKSNPHMSTGDWTAFYGNTMKELAKKYGCTIITLYQFDKEVLRKDSKGKRKIPSMENVLGGIGAKASMDTALVLYINDQNERFVYWDKIRDVYNSQYEFVHWKIDCDPEIGMIRSIAQKVESEGIFEQ